MAQRDMGIGELGRPDVIFKRDFRFTFRIFGFCGNQKNEIPESFVKSAGRPRLTIEDTQIDFLNARTWIPGKSYWNTLDVVYQDVAHASARALWDWMTTVYDFTNPVKLRQGDRPNWDATGVLILYDGCGTPLEQWSMLHVFPTEINFGDVSYDSNNISEVTLTLRYSDVEYRSLCPVFQPNPCCTGCNPENDFTDDFGD